jgi:hypothetical protein
LSKCTKKVKLKTKKGISKNQTFFILSFLEHFVAFDHSSFSGQPQEMDTNMGIEMGANRDTDKDADTDKDIDMEIEVNV